MVVLVCTTSCSDLLCIDFELAVIMVQAENEFSAGTGRSDYMQNIIDLYRANGIVVREYLLR